MALAIATTFQNILMTLLPILFGKLNLDRTPGAYNRSLGVLSGLSFCGMLSSAALIKEDNKSGGVLYLPENDHRVLSHKQSLSADMEKIINQESTALNTKAHSDSCSIQIDLNGIELRLLENC